MTEQRQRARFVAQLADDDLDEARLDAQTAPRRRFGDGPLQLLPRQRADEHVVGGEDVAELAEPGQLAVEVGAEGDDGPALVASDGVEERLLLGAIAAERHDLLELVDDEHRARRRLLER